MARQQRREYVTCDACGKEHDQDHNDRSPFSPYPGVLVAQARYRTSSTDRFSLTSGAGEYVIEVTVCRDDPNCRFSVGDLLLAKSLDTLGMSPRKTKKLLVSAGRYNTIPVTGVALRSRPDANERNELTNVEPGEVVENMMQTENGFQQVRFVRGGTHYAGWMMLTFLQEIADPPEPNLFEGVDQ